MSAARPKFVSRRRTWTVILDVEDIVLSFRTRRNEGASIRIAAYEVLALAEWLDEQGFRLDDDEEAE